ncbi:MAG: hypothetical protein ACLGHT_01990, partial [Acidimicrobiia bacterium]
MYDAAKAERIRRGTQSEPDDRAARWLIDELIKTCVRDPDGESMGTRYDTLMTALEAVRERQEIGWSPKYRSLRAFGRGVDLSRVPTMLVYRTAGEQFESLLDALDSDVRLFEPVDVDEEEELEDWEAVDQEVENLREDFATADSASDYANLARQCREIFVSLAEAAFDAERHGPLKKPKDGGGGTVKLRLEAVIRMEAAGSAREELRAVALKTLDLANKLQHRKTTTRPDAASLCDCTV